MNQFMSALFRLMPEIPFNKDKTNIFEKVFCLFASGMEFFSDCENYLFEGSSVRTNGIQRRKSIPKFILFEDSILLN